MLVAHSSSHIGCWSKRPIIARMLFKINCPTTLNGQPCRCLCMVNVCILVCFKKYLFKCEARGQWPRRKMSEQVRLFSSLKEREHYDNMADLYSIFVATENLEKSYIRDIITAEEYVLFGYCNSPAARYTPACSKLIAQFKTCLNSLGTDFNIQSFLEKYDVQSYHELSLTRLGALPGGFPPPNRSWRPGDHRTSRRQRRPGGDDQVCCGGRPGMRIVGPSPFHTRLSTLSR